MLTVFRSMGMPPIVVGMIGQMGRGIPDDALRDMCARVAFGMLRIYTGDDVSESLSIEELVSPDMDMLIDRLTLMRDTDTIPHGEIAIPQLVESNSMPSYPPMAQTGEHHTQYVEGVDDNGAKTPLPYCKECSDEAQQYVWPCAVYETVPPALRSIEHITPPVAVASVPPDIKRFAAPIPDTCICANPDGNSSADFNPNCKQHPGIHIELLTWERANPDEYAERQRQEALQALADVGVTADDVAEAEVVEPLTSMSEQDWLDIDEAE